MKDFWDRVLDYALEFVSREKLIAGERQAANDKGTKWLAEKMGLSAQAITLKRKRHTPPKESEIQFLATLFGVSRYRLLTDHEEDEDRVYLHEKADAMSGAAVAKVVAYIKAMGL